MQNKKFEQKKRYCFVCMLPISPENINFNKTVGLPVCEKCMGSKEEKKAIQEALESLGDGFVCGCI